VVCEGERTEPDYIDGFRREKRYSLVELEVVPSGGDPKKIVETARRRKNAAERQAQREADAFADFDEVWCVFDRDRHHAFDAACKMARRSGFSLAVSNPCVELWLLLHFRDSPGAQECTSLCRMLRRHLPSYEKRVEFADFKVGLDEATDRARRLDEDARRMGEDGRNPTTSFYLLTEAIAREAKR
jgi:hypothetical protein